jgi:hypothetical protein
LTRSSGRRRIPASHEVEKESAMGGSERAEDERQTAEEDAMEDLELNAETAGEVGGGTDPPPPPPLITAWPREGGG